MTHTAAIWTHYTLSQVQMHATADIMRRELTGPGMQRNTTGQGAVGSANK